MRDSGHVFVGTGVAWTPLDREDEGRLFSLQFGVSRDTTFREEIDGVAQSTGGHTFALHPTAIVAAGKHALVFVVTSINVGEQWRDPLEHENFRLGVGTILKLGQ